MTTKFFPVTAAGVTATTSSAATLLPTGGKYYRITRENNASRVFIKFGSSDVVATTNTSMELLPGIAEEFASPNSNLYTYFAVITDASTCGVNISASPTFSIE